MKIVKKYGVIIALVLCSIFALSDFCVYATGSPTDIFSGDYATYYGVNGLIDSTSYSSILAYAIANEATHYVDNNNTPSIDISSFVTSDYIGGFYNANGYDILSSAAYFDQGNYFAEYSGPYDISGWDTVFFTYEGDTNYNKYLVLRIEHNDNLALLDGKYIVSDSPIKYYVGAVSYYSGAWNQVDIYNNFPRQDTVSSSSSAFNNYYVLTVPNDLLSYSVRPRIFFTDLDIYCSNDDIESFTYSNFDFDNADSYFNYNFLKVSGDIVNPNEPTSNPVNQEAISNLMFRDSTFYAGNVLQHIYHSNRLTFNEYQLSHPENFYINFDYYFYYKDDSMGDIEEFRYKLPGSNDYGQKYSLDLFLGYVNRFGGMPVNLDLSILHFIPIEQSHNNYTLQDYIILCVSRVTGVGQNYADPNSIFAQAIWEPSVLVTRIDNMNFGKNNSWATFYALSDDFLQHIEKFEIRSEVTITYKDNPMYSSGVYKDFYDFRSEVGGVISNESADNNYPSNDSSNLPIPSGDSGGNTVNTGGGAVNTAYGGNVTFNGVVQRVFEPFALDTVTVAGVGDNWNTLIRSIQDTSDNGFWSVLEETYNIIPSEVWGWLTAAVSAILGCAVFRFYITAIRG